MDSIVELFSQEAWSWVIAGLLGLGASRLVRWWRRKGRQLDARSAFGAVETGGKIVVELAQWSLRRGPRDRPRLYVAFPGEDRELYGPDHLAAVSDVEVASIVTEAVVEAYGCAPIVTAGPQAAQYDDDGASVIYIGSSLVNPKVDSLLDAAGDDFPVRFAEIQEDDGTGASICIRYIDSAGERGELRSTKNTDYAIVVRLPREGGTYDFIVGGIHAEGTVGAGEWLRRNWRRFHQAAPRSGALLEIDRRRPKSQIKEMSCRGLSDGSRGVFSFQRLRRL